MVASVRVGVVCCYRKYLLELVHRSLQQITSSQALNGHLPVSIDNMSCIADKFVSAADMLPTLLVSCDDLEKQVCSSHLCLIVSCQRFILKVKAFDLYSASSR